MAWIIVLALAGLAALAALAAAVAVTARRGLVELQDARQGAWAALESQLVKRQELMERIVLLCSRALAYEGEALARATHAGAAVISAARRADTPALAAAEMTHEAAVAFLLELAGNHPQLADSQAFAALRERIGILDARVAERREQYNSVASVLNVRRSAFPHRLVARTLGLEPAAFLS
ncbi:MAG: LemA family protein [Steroidobacteraceae bacterium]